MANTKSTQHEIDLTGGLNLNKFKADIKPYEGFNERNAPYYGGCLSPLYIKDDGEVTEYTKYVDGVKWETKSGYLYKNDEIVMSFDRAHYTKKRISSISGFENKDILNYFDENNYIENTSNSIIIHHNGFTETYATSEYVYVDSRFFYNTTNNKVIFAVHFLHKPYGGSLRRECIFNNDDESIGSFIVRMDAYYIECFGLNQKYIQINEAVYNRQSHYYVGIGNVYWDGTNLNVYYDSSSSFIIYESDKSNFMSKYATYGYGLYIPICNIGCGYSGFQISQTSVGGKIGFQLRMGSYSNEIDSRYGHKILSWLSSSQYQIMDKVTDYNNYQLRTYCGNIGSMLCVAVDNVTDDSKKLMGTIVPSNSSFVVSNALTNLCYSIFNNNGDFLGATGSLGYDNLITDNTGVPLAISHGDTLITSWGSVGQKPVNTRNNNSTTVYFDADLNDWVEIDTTVLEGNDFRIINDFVVVNTTSHENCYNIKTNEAYHWGSCWMNNITEMKTSDPIHSCIFAFDSYPIAPGGFKSAKASIGENINWLSPAPSSAKFGSTIIYYYAGAGSRKLTPYQYAISENNPLDMYIDDKYYTSFMKTDFVSGSYISTKRAALEGTTYPGDAVRYNLPLLFDVISGVLDTTIVNFGSDVSFFTIYYDNRQRYQYYSSSITEFEQFFIIQAQAYGIKDKKIYAVNYLNNVIQASQAVVSIEGLQFVGNTIYNAYFYSPTTKAIYSFGADNNLVVFAQADTFGGITGSSYLPGTSSIILGTPDCAYVLNEKFGIYRLNDIKGLRYASQKPDSVVLVLDDHAYEISYIDRDTTEDWEKIDIVCDTAFYGAGSNVVSVNDCWYVRITDPEHKAGEIKLAVSTLTDIGRSTETRTFKVKESDWDELTDTIYIRFQPKLQRAVGVSLHIESPFKIGYIGVGATPETLQLNKGTI
jgi:hypothetical protein